MIRYVRRREVLKAGAVLATAAGFGVMSKPSFALPLSLTVVEEVGVPESRRFAAKLKETGYVARTICVDRSLTALLCELDDCRGLVVGLSSDPVAMIAGQLLIERGARSHLQWRHRQHADGHWHHQLHTTTPSVRNQPGSWPQGVAQRLLDALSAEAGQIENSCEAHGCTLARSSPGMLVSWAHEIAWRHS
jgi:hypothetical protein